MVFKPSEVTPLTALKLAEIYTEAGVPAGVFNVVPAAAASRQWLTEHPVIEKIHRRHHHRQESHGRVLVAEGSDHGAGRQVAAGDLR
jgi:hypothetical protein